MHKNFSFKGINRSTDVILAQDGECLDIVNLRMSNGSLHPIPQPLPVAEVQGRYSAFYWHETADSYIAVTDDAVRTLHFFKKDFTPILSGESILTIDGLRLVNGVECIGNIVCCMTDLGLFYIMFENGIYNGLGERPQIPPVNISVSSKLETLKTEESYYTMATTSDLEATWNYNEKGYIEECVSVLNKAGYYIDRALFRIALRLYDGSYIDVSNVIYLSDETFENEVGRDSNNMKSEALSTNVPSQYYVYVRGFKVEFSFDTTTLSNWRSIVVGIDLFSTASIPGKKCALSGRTQKFEMFTAKPLDELWDETASSSLYYKVAEYDIDGNLLSRLDDVSPVNLALQQGLETMNVPSSYSSVDVKKSYVYNGRLHIAAFREIPFNGYGAAAYLPVSSAVSEVDSMSVLVKMRTTQGEYTVGKVFEKPILGDDGHTLVLPPMLSYPDARAYEMQIYIKKENVVYSKIFPLTAHKYLNISYYLHKWYSPYSTSVTAEFANGGKPGSTISDEDMLRLFNNETGVHEVIYSASRNCWTYRGEQFPPEEFSASRLFAIHRNAVDGDKLIFTINRDGTGNLSFKDIYNIPVDTTWDILDSMPDGELQHYEKRRNVMKVSMVENPFVFPAKCTYAPSQSAIVGMSSNTIALSQGQFGQFPLYVFCADGIWAMSVDSSGTVAYLASHQVSRDVCINANTICGISGGVVFAGKQGMMLITGNSIKKISLAMEGNGISLTGVPGDIFARISSLVSLEECVGSDDFQTFISDANVAYLPAHNEILVYNQAYKYSFIYSFVSAMWTRFQGQFHGRIYGCVTPHLFTFTDRGTSIFMITDEISGSNRFLLISRPQLWGTKLPKRVLQLLLYAYLEPPEERTPGVPLLGCYMLASNDGVHFKIIAGSEKNDRTQDVMFPYFPTQSYKYYLFALVGELGKASVMTGMEIDVNVPWKNRLR